MPIDGSLEKADLTDFLSLFYQQVEFRLSIAFISGRFVCAFHSF